MTIILSFDVGLINLSYCILTKKIFNDNSKIEDWDILEWNIIDLTNRSNEICCICSKKASLNNIINNITKYYCRIHGKNINIIEDEFINHFNKYNNKDKLCNYSKNNKNCKKNGIYCKDEIIYIILRLFF